MQNNSLVEGFRQSYPGFAKEAVSIEPNGVNTVLVTFQTGLQLEWHRGLNTVQVINRIERPDDEMMWRVKFQYEINKRMSDLNIDIPELSQKTGITSRTLYNYLDKKTTPSCWNLRRIAAALECDVADLI